MAKEVLELEVKTNVKGATRGMKQLGNAMSDAEINLQELNDSYELQVKYVNDLEQALLKMKQQQTVNSDYENSVSGLNDKIRETTATLLDEKQGLKDLKAERKEATDSLKEAQRNQEIVNETFFRGIKHFQVMGVSLRRIRLMTRAVIPGFKLMFKTIKTGIASTGIGLIVLAIGAVGTAMARTSKGATAFKAVLAGLKEVVNFLLKPLELAGDAILKLFGVKESGAVDTAAKLANEMAAINRTAAEIEAKRIGEKEQVRELQDIVDDVNATEQERLAAQHEINELAKQANVDNLNQARENLRLATEASERAHSDLEYHKLINAEKKTINEFQKIFNKKYKAYLDMQNEIARLEDNFNVIRRTNEAAIAGIRNTNHQKRVNNQNKIAENARRIAEEQERAEEKLAGIILKIEQDLQLELIESEEEKQLKILEFKNEAAIKDIENSKATQETKNAVLLLLEEQYLNDQQEIRNTFRQKEEDEAEKAAAKLAEQTAKQLELDEKEAEKRKQLEHDVLNAKLGLTAQGFAVIASMSKEGSAIAKKAAVAEAMVTGSQAVLNAYKSAQDSPITTLFPAYPILQAGLAAAFSAAQIKKIQAGEGPEGTVPETAGIDTTPAPGMMGGAFTLEGAQAPEPLRAYVVTDEMTNSQNQLANIRRRATI